jgi:outer membrane scaffolding protein for murein synthesis (MipA/OmpV family)
MRRIACAALLAALIATPAIAQDQPAAAPLPSPDEISKRDTVTVGVGAAAVPDYEGSDDYRIVPFGAIRGKVGGISFSTKGTYLYVDLAPKTGGKVEFDAGAIAGVRMGTRRHIKDDIVELLPRRHRAIEIGGFAGVSLHGLTNPYDSLSLDVDVLNDVGNAHKSTVVSPNATFSTPLSRRTYASLSAGMDFVSNKYADYYFSITPAEALATGGKLPAFDADGGMKSWKIGLLLNQSVTGDLLHGISVFGLGQYSRLVGDFKRSPIVSQRGSASQWIGALGLAYTW